jgi:hypothetical protein
MVEELIGNEDLMLALLKATNKTEDYERYFGKIEHVIGNEEDEE